MTRTTDSSVHLLTDRERDELAVDSAALVIRKGYHIDVARKIVRLSDAADDALVSWLDEFQSRGNVRSPRNHLKR